MLTVLVTVTVLCIDKSYLTLKKFLFGKADALDILAFNYFNSCYILKVAPLNKFCLTLTLALTSSVSAWEDKNRVKCLVSVYLSSVLQFAVHSSRPQGGA